MFRLLLATTLFAFSALPVLAQLARFHPLQEGNEWAFASNGPGTAGASTETTSIVRAQGEGTMPGTSEPAMLLECQELSTDGSTVLATGHYAFPAEPLELGARAGVRVSGASVHVCDFLFFETGPPEVDEESTVIAIGESSYTVDGVLHAFGAGGPHPGSEELLFASYAANVGPYYVEQAIMRNGDPNPFSDTIHLLQYALVDGETFGTQATESESTPTAPISPALRAYPSPTAAAVTLNGADGAVTVFDLLGRRVTAVEATPGHPVRLDVSAWPAGLYVARVLTADGPQTARFVVAR